MSLVISFYLPLSKNLQLPHKAIELLFCRCAPIPPLLVGIDFNSTPLMGTESILFKPNAVERGTSLTMSLKVDLSDSL